MSESLTSRSTGKDLLPLTGAYFVALLILPSLIFPGPPRVRDMADLTIVGRLTSFVMFIFGIGVAPEHGGFFLIPEIKLLAINPGFYIGIAIGISGQRFIHSLFPMGMALAICVLFFLIPGGIWLLASLVPLIFMTAPYSPLGFIIGRKLRGVRRAKSGIA